jgi:hypothetical protein
VAGTSVRRTTAPTQLNKMLSRHREPGNRLIVVFGKLGIQKDWRGMT